MRNRLPVIATVIAVVALLAVYALPAYSDVVVTGSGFEGADGNLDPVSATDWNTFDGASTPAWSGTAPTRTAAQQTIAGWSFAGQEDYQATGSDTSFSGGTKQDDNCPSVITQKPDNKADLKRIYLASKVGSNDHTYLALAWIRIPQNTTSPSAHIAFEFNKGTSACAGAGHDGLVSRVAGDMLIVYDFEGGSTDNPHIHLKRWVTSGACDISNHTAPCWGTDTDLTATDPLAAEAKVNTDGSVTDKISPFTANQTLGTNEFGETIVDLTNAGVFTAGVCESFGKAFGVSRTSGNSGTAQMKDLVGPLNFTIQNCGSVDVSKSNSDGSSPAGAVFTLYEGSDTTGTVVGTCTVQADGTCVNDDSNVTSPPSFPGLSAGTYTLDETTVPANFTKDGDLPETFTVDAGEAVTKSYTNVANPNVTSITTEISLDDHATIAGFDANFPGSDDGTLTFSLYGPDDTDCDGTPVYTTTIDPIDGPGPWSTADGDNADAFYTVPLTAEAQGQYDWVVTYSGDNAGVNLPSSSDCGDESATVDYGLVSN